MNERLAAIGRRREMLVARAALQRSEVSYEALRWERRLRIVDATVAVVRTFRSHPVLAAVAVTLLVGTPQHKLALWAGRIFTGWELFQALREQLLRRRV